MEKSTIKDQRICDIFKELNRDRSEDWSAYDENSTFGELLEGIDQFLN